MLSLSVSILIVVLAPLLSWFFGDPRLTPLIMLSASAIILNALGQQVRLSAEKELNFRPIALLEIISQVVGLGSAVLAALSGWGVYSLVLAGVVSAFVATALAWTFVGGGWRPKLHLRLNDVKSFLGFGGASVANDIVNQLNLAIDLFLGGRLLGSAQLGLYSVPRNLTLQLQWIINPIITRVGFPLIAQVQSDANRVKYIYLKSMNMTASVNAPLYVGIAFFASDIVNLLLGEAWSRSTELLRILAMWGGIRSTGNPVGSLLFGMGRADLALKWNLALLLFMPLFIVLGAQQGTNGIAWAMLSVQAVLFVPAWLVLVRPLCGAGIVEYSFAALRPFILAAIAIAPAFAVASQLSGTAERLVTGVLLSALLYSGISFLANRDWTSEMVALVMGESAKGQGKE
jgi:O-antigen/teichoic acid export membrane protein